MLHNLILIVRDTQKMKIKIFLSPLFLSFQALIAEPTLEDQVKAAKKRCVVALQTWVSVAIFSREI